MRSASRSRAPKVAFSRTRSGGPTRLARTDRFANGRRATRAASLTNRKRRGTDAHPSGAGGSSSAVPTTNRTTGIQRWQRIAAHKLEPWVRSSRLYAGCARSWSAPRGAPRADEPPPEDVGLAVMMPLDVIEPKGRTNIVALGITSEGAKIPVGVAKSLTDVRKHPVWSDNATAAGAVRRASGVAVARLVRRPVASWLRC